MKTLSDSIIEFIENKGPINGITIQKELFPFKDRGQIYKKLKTMVSSGELLKSGTLYHLPNQQVKYQLPDRRSSLPNLTSLSIPKKVLDNHYLRQAALGYLIENDSKIYWNTRMDEDTPAELVLKLMRILNEIYERFGISIATNPVLAELAVISSKAKTTNE